MSHLVRNLDAEIEQGSLLKHSFYKMWSDGKLTREHLAGYSQEYFQLVRAVPELVEKIRVFVEDAPTKNVVSGIMEEEAEHVQLWAKFAVETRNLGTVRERVEVAILAGVRAAVLAGK